MKYQLNNPEYLHRFDFATSTHQDAKNYFSWYIAQIPLRCPILEAAIQTTNQIFANWQANYTAESLKLLGKWFYQAAKWEPTSEEFRQNYLKKAQVNLPEHLWSIIETPKFVLTQQTWSLIIDLGMYFGETLRQNTANVKWHLWTKGGKKDADYHQPILVNSALKRTCNPQRLMRVMALHFCERTQSPERLYELFELRAFALAGQ